MTYDKKEWDEMLLHAANTFMHVMEDPDFSLSTEEYIALAWKKRKSIVSLKRLLDEADYTLYSILKHYGMSVCDIKDSDSLGTLNGARRELICIGYASRLLLEDTPIEEKACSLYNMKLMLSKYCSIEDLRKSHPLEGAWVKNFVTNYAKLTQLEANIQRQAEQ